MATQRTDARQADSVAETATAASHLPALARLERIRYALGVCVALAALSACSDRHVTTPPGAGAASDTVLTVETSVTDAEANAIVSDSVRAFVRTSGGKPIPGVYLEAAALAQRCGFAGGACGVATPSSAITDANGRVAFQWALYRTSGTQTFVVMTRLHGNTGQVTRQVSVSIAVRPAVALRVTADSDTLHFFVGDTLTLDSRDGYDNETDPQPGSALRFATAHPDVFSVHERLGLVRALQPGVGQLVVSGPVPRSFTVIVHPFRRTWYPLSGPGLSSTLTPAHVVPSPTRVLLRNAPGPSTLRLAANGSWEFETGIGLDAPLFISSTGVAWGTSASGSLLYRSPSAGTWTTLPAIAPTGMTVAAAHDTLAVVSVPNAVSLVSLTSTRALPFASLSQYAIADEGRVYRVRPLDVGSAPGSRSWEVSILAGSEWTTIASPTFAGFGGSASILARPGSPEALLAIKTSGTGGLQLHSYRLTPTALIPLGSGGSGVTSDGLGNAVHYLSAVRGSGFTRSTPPSGFWPLLARYALSSARPGPGRALWLTLTRLGTTGGYFALVMVEPL